ncbi:hypothetical protein [Methylobacterium fujisawaense]|jgi:hypothetical protein
MSTLSARGNRNSLLLATALVCLAGPALAGGRTIVGQWAPDPKNCVPSAGAIMITALGLTADEMSCDFKSVARQGDQVTWRGKCAFSDATKASTVVATLNGPSLSVRVNGQPADTYRRCGA